MEGGSVHGEAAEDGQDAETDRAITDGGGSVRRIRKSYRGGGGFLLTAKRRRGP